MHSKTDESDGEWKRQMHAPAHIELYLQCNRVWDDAIEQPWLNFYLLLRLQTAENAYTAFTQSTQTTKCTVYAINVSVFRLLFLLVDHSWTNALECVGPRKKKTYTYTNNTYIKNT